MNILMLDNIVPDVKDGENKRKNPRRSVRRLTPSEYENLVSFNTMNSRNFLPASMDDNCMGRIFEFLTEAVESSKYGFVIHENRTTPITTGTFPSSVASQLVMAYVRDFIHNDDNSSINASYNKESENDLMLHIDINSKTPFESTITNMLNGVTRYSR